MGHAHPHRLIFVWCFWAMELPNQGGSQITNVMLVLARLRKLLSFSERRETNGAKGLDTR